MHAAGAASIKSARPTTHYEMTCAILTKLSSNQGRYSTMEHLDKPLGALINALHLHSAALRYAFMNKSCLRPHQSGVERFLNVEADK